MMKQVQLTSKQAIILLILSTIGFTFYFATLKTPIEQLKSNMVAVFIENDTAVKDTTIIVAKIVAQAKDSEKCADFFNEVVIPATNTLSDGRVRTKDQIEKGINILILGIEKACQR